MDKTIGDRIREKRIAVGISPETLAERLTERGCPVTYQSVQHWEKNRTKPRRKLVPMIAEELRTTISFLELGIEITEDDLSPKEQVLITAFRALMDFQQDQLVGQAESQLEANRRLAKQTREAVERALPDSLKVVPFPAPKGKVAPGNPQDGK